MCMLSSWTGIKNFHYMHYTEDRNVSVSKDREVVTDISGTKRDTPKWSMTIAIEFSVLPGLPSTRTVAFAE